MYGVDNHGNRNKFIISVMKTFFDLYGTNVFTKEPFYQLRTFVCTTSAAGVEKWGTKDTQKYRDDVLFGIVFAYICSMAYEYELPQQIDKGDVQRFRTIHRLVRDKNGNLTRVPERVAIF